jgi:hypothetical protein
MVPLCDRMKQKVNLHVREKKACVFFLSFYPAMLGSVVLPAMETCVQCSLALCSTCEKSECDYCHKIICELHTWKSNNNTSCMFCVFAIGLHDPQDRVEFQKKDGRNYQSCHLACAQLKLQQMLHEVSSVWQDSIAQYRELCAKWGLGWFVFEDADTHYSSQFEIVDKNVLFIPKSFDIAKHIAFMIRYHDVVLGKKFVLFGILDSQKEFAKDPNALLKIDFFSL